MTDDTATCPTCARERMTITGRDDAHVTDLVHALDRCCVTAATLDRAALGTWSAGGTIADALAVRERVMTIIAGGAVLGAVLRREAN